MAVWVKTGTFNTPASGQTTIDCSAEDGPPVAVHFFGGLAIANATTQSDACVWHGIADGTAEYSTSCHKDASDGSTQRMAVSDSCVTVGDAAADNYDVRGGISGGGLTSTSVVITYSLFTLGIPINYVIWGGTDTSVTISEHVANDSPHTGTGFTADLILFFCAGQLYPAGDAITQSVHGYQSFGAVTDNGASIDQWTLFSYIGDGDLDFIGAGLLPAFAAGQYDVDFPNWVITVTAIGSDGYTYTGSNTDEIVTMSLNFGGSIGVDVGTFSKSTSTSTPVAQTVALGFTPQAYWLSSACNTVTVINTSIDCRVAHGAYDGTNAVSCTVTADVALAADTHSRIDNNRIAVHSTNLNADGLTAIANASAIEGAEISLSWITNNAVADVIGYWAIQAGPISLAADAVGTSVAIAGMSIANAASADAVGQTVATVGFVTTGLVSADAVGQAVATAEYLSLVLLTADAVGQAVATAIVSAPLVAELEGYQWRLDDGDEVNATAAASQDTDISAGVGVNRRLRTLIDYEGNPGTHQARLQYRKVGDPDSEWEDV